MRVMHRLGNRVQKAAVGVGGEIDGDRRSRCHGADDLDIEHHLAIGAVGVAGRRVGAAIDRDGAHRRCRREAQLLKVGGDIGGAAAASPPPPRRAPPRARPPPLEVIKPPPPLPWVVWPPLPWAPPPARLWAARTPPTPR